MSYNFSLYQKAGDYITGLSAKGESRLESEIIKAAGRTLLFNSCKSNGYLKEFPEV